jgi:hypothetical protein
MSKKRRASKMKITKSQLKQIIKEEISKVLSEGPADVPEPGLPSQNVNMMNPVDVLKQMINDEVSDASPKDIKAYLNSIKDTKDFELALNVIQKVQAAAKKGKDFDFRKEFGPSVADEDYFEPRKSGRLYGPLGDPYGAMISPSEWYNDLRHNRPLFDDLIEMFKKYYYRYR